MRYIRYLYKNCVTYIQVDGQLSPPVRVRRGVRQGDPLSCHLFNCVIDLALSNLDNEVGIHIWNSFLNDMAFADDMCLLATTPAGLQRNLDLLHNSLRASGMEISTGVGGKSASLRIDIDGKAKRWVVNPNSHLTVGEGLIPALSITQCYNYPVL